MKKRIYIAGPISKGDLGVNIERASKAFYRLLGHGFAPLCPHWSCFSGEIDADPITGVALSFADPLPRGTSHEDWIGLDLPWVAVADGVLRLPGESAGADREVAEAERLGIPVFHSIGDCVWYFVRLTAVGEAAAKDLAANVERASKALLRGAIKGVGPDAPVAVNASGGKQSATPYRCDLLPPHAALAVSEVLAHGAAKYGANNWHAISVAEHLNHALAHLFADRAGDVQDDHLEHAACRLLMALDQRRSGREVSS